MSAEITPSIARAAEVNYLTRAGFRDDSREMYRASGEAVLQSWANATRPVVDAALDVEEMAAAIWASDYADSLALVDRFQEQDEETRNEYLNNARAIRTIVLGADS